MQFLPSETRVSSEHVINHWVYSGQVSRDKYHVLLPVLGSLMVLDSLTLMAINRNGTTGTYTTTIGTYYTNPMPYVCGIYIRSSMTLQRGVK